MQIEQRRWMPASGWDHRLEGGLGSRAQLVLLFGSPAALQAAEPMRAVRAAYPDAHVAGCSTAGEIYGAEVTDETLTATAAAFAHTRVRIARVPIAHNGESQAAGELLAEALEPQGLRHVLVFSDGQRVNGSALVAGLQHRLPPGVTVTGGLAGDGTRFQHTWVVADGAPAEGQVAAVGFYGEHCQVGHGSLGGWDPFGPERIITKASGNVLHTLDGQPALQLYKRYLGEHAAGLPATGLLFPLNLRFEDGRSDVVRTILAVDEAAQSMTFAGDMPVGAYARLMKANFDRLVDGAHGAARISHDALGGVSAGLAVLISCVGRKLVLQQRTAEELEAVREVLGAQTVLTGFYSYGEICPAAPRADCQLHNQTMTITTITER